MRTRGARIAAGAAAVVAAAFIGSVIDLEGSPLAPLRVRIVESELGSITAVTKPGANCQALVMIPNGVGRPHRLGNPLLAGPNGTVSWSYLASFAGVHGKVVHTVSCSYAGATSIERSEVESAPDLD